MRCPFFCSWLFLILLFSPTIQSAEKPNIIVFLADDLGYGDLGSYGHPLNKTPNIDAIGSEGIRLNSFMTDAWCTPSRVQLMTGRYFPRVDLGGSVGPDGPGGLPDGELTLAEGLKEAGYKTHMIGKWHLGFQKQFLPTNQGFDTWLGLPYSNDFIKPWVQTDVPLGLYRDVEQIETTLDQDALTTRYTDEAVKLINEQKPEQPFFLYLGYAMPHLPIAVSDKRRGRSAGGLYGDVIEELDWSIGRVLGTLATKGLDKNTIVLFLSDNGPWTNMPDRMKQSGVENWHAGSVGLLQGFKHSSYEGGTRVPALIRWPQKIVPGQVRADLVAMPDIYTTLLLAAGGTLPDLTIDGLDLRSFLTNPSVPSPRNEYLYLLHGALQAIRLGEWKLRTSGTEIELFNLVRNPSETINFAAEMPEKVNQLQSLMAKRADELEVKLSTPKIASSKADR